MCVCRIHTLRVLNGWILTHVRCVWRSLTNFVGSQKCSEKSIHASGVYIHTSSWDTILLTTAETFRFAVSSKSVLQLFSIRMILSRSPELFKAPVERKSKYCRNVDHSIITVCETLTYSTTASRQVHHQAR